MRPNNNKKKKKKKKKNKNKNKKNKKNKNHNNNNNWSNKFCNRCLPAQSMLFIQYKKPEQKAWLQTFKIALANCII